MKQFTKHIPNLLTLSNALSGAVAIYYAFAERDLAMAMNFMLLSALLDFLDGFAARLLKAYSPLGKDLDSLADAISFGLTPAAMMMVAMQELGLVMPWLALLIVPASILRLAKFNHDTRQSISFLGLPTPANALFFGGLSYWMMGMSQSLQHLPIMIAYKAYPMYYIIIIGMCWLLNSEVPMFSLKGLKAPTPRATIGRWIELAAVVAVAGVGFIFWHYSAFALAILLYILINLVHHLRHRIP